jgi:hypothetical protein
LGLAVVTALMPSLQMEAIMGTKTTPTGLPNVKSAHRRRTASLKAKRAATSKAKKTPGHNREHSKLATMITMLRTTRGSTIEELSKATGWQAHSVRGAISGTIKKRLDLGVTSVKTDGVRTYRINS